MKKKPAVKKQTPKSFRQTFAAQPSKRPAKSEGRPPLPGGPTTPEMVLKLAQWVEGLQQRMLEHEQRLVALEARAKAADAPKAEVEVSTLWSKDEVPS